LKQEQNAVKEQQNNLNIGNMEGVNKLVAKEMIVNQDSHFKNEIDKLEGMIANNDYGSMFMQKSNSSKAMQVPQAAPIKPAAAQIKVNDAQAVVAANDAALAAAAAKEQPQKSPDVPVKDTTADLSIETSKLDDTNFDNLGKSLDTGKSQDDIKKEVNNMAETLAKKDAAEKQRVSEEKTAQQDEDSQQQ
jgi:hypothetical protein